MANWFSKLYQFTLPPVEYENSCCSMFLRTPCVVCLLHFSHSVHGVVIDMTVQNHNTKYQVISSIQEWLGGLEVERLHLLHIWVKRARSCKIRMVIIHSLGPFYILIVVLINYEMTIIWYVGHISQTTRQQNRYLFSPPVLPIFLPESMVTGGVDRILACRDAEMILSAMGTISAEMQSRDQTGFSIPVKEQSTEDLSHVLGVDKAYS